jgi:hypothetical protein
VRCGLRKSGEERLDDQAGQLRGRLVHGHSARIMDMTKIRTSKERKKSKETRRRWHLEGTREKIFVGAAACSPL